MTNATIGFRTPGTALDRALVRTVTFLGALVAFAAPSAAQDAQAPFELMGAVVDASTRAPLAGAFVSLAGSDWGSVTDDRGRFRIPDMDAGPLALSVELLGYEPHEWNGVVSAETSVEIAVSPKPLLLEGLEVVTDRFRSRRNAAPTSVWAYDTAELATATQRSALEFVEQRSGTARVRCAGRRSDTCLWLRGRPVEPAVYLDEVPVMGGLEYLDTFQPHELYLIEVYGGGRHIRAYTPRFMERAANQRLHPLPLLF